MAKREMSLSTRERNIHFVLEETLDELIKLQLTLELKNDSVIHRTYDRLQRMSVYMATGMNETFQLTSENYKRKSGFNPTKKKLDPKSNSNNIIEGSGTSLDIESNERYSCDEIYNGSLFGYPSYLKGFVRLPCDRILFTQSVSLILERPTTDLHYLQKLLDKTTIMFKEIYLIIHTKEEYILNKLKFWSNIKVYLYGEGYKELGSSLSDILDDVTAFFVLIATNIVEFIEENDVERLVDVYTKTHARVVGTATKNIHTGEWKRNCYQSKLQMYTLEYNQGYSLSNKGCLKCDFVTGSYLSSRNTLRSVGFNKNLTFGVHDDLFLRLKSSNYTVYDCPDVMFYGYEQPKLSNKDLIPFSNEWDIKKIVYPDKSVHWFGCRKGHSHTTHARCPYHKGMTVPPCCIENLKDVLNFLFQQCALSEISCELQEGSVLGMVKFHGILPWERDADVSVFSDDLYKIEQLADVFKLKGYELVIDEKPTVHDNRMHGGVFHIRAHGWSIQIFGTGNMTSQKKRKTGNRTRIFMKNGWVYVPENPGKYSRNRYGLEIYKHAEHWMTSGLKSGWTEYKAGKFETCSVPGHHACLDQFVADGDLTFDI